MSSVRISPHNHSSAAPPGSGESSRANAPPSGASFSATLGAAAPEATLSAQAADAARASRKRPGNDEKGGDPTAAQAAQDALLTAAAGEAVALPRDASGTGRASEIALDRDVSATSLSATKLTAGNPVSTSAAAPGDAAPNMLLHPGTALIATARLAEKDAPATATDASLGLTPADTGETASGVSANLGSELQPAPNANFAQAPPAELTELAQALPALAAGQLGAGNGDPTAGGESRGRFVQVAAASEGSRATEAAALGATGETPALANAPAANASPATLADATATAGISDQVAGHVLRLVASGSRDMVMRLHPPELGEVTVHVAVNGRDVSAWFGSPQPQVQTAITDGIGQLQTGLGNAGYNLSGAWVGADASGARQQAGSLTPLPVASATAPAVDFGVTAATRPPTSGLNIYV